MILEQLIAAGESVVSLNVDFVQETYYSSGKLPGKVKKGSFWWRDVLKLLDKFKGMARVQINNGQSCLMWDDLWGAQPASLRFPELHSFAKKEFITFAQGVASNPFHNLFHLPLSQQAQLQSEMQDTQQKNDLSDKLSYIWNTEILFS